MANDHCTIATQQKRTDVETNVETVCPPSVQHRSTLFDSVQQNRTDVETNVEVVCADLFTFLVLEFASSVQDLECLVKHRKSNSKITA